MNKPTDEELNKVLGDILQAEKRAVKKIVKEHKYQEQLEKWNKRVGVASNKK